MHDIAPLPNRPLTLPNAPTGERPQPNLPNPSTPTQPKTWLNGSTPAADLPGTDLADRAEVQLLVRHIRQDNSFEPASGDSIVPVFLSGASLQGGFASLDDALGAARHLTQGSHAPALAILAHPLVRPGGHRFVLQPVATMSHSTVQDLGFETGMVTTETWVAAPIIDAQFGGPGGFSAVQALVDGDAVIGRGPLS